VCVCVRESTGAEHSVGLAAPGLPIREQRDIVTVESALHELRHLAKHLLLRRARVEGAVRLCVREGEREGGRERERPASSEG